MINKIIEWCIYAAGVAVIIPGLLWVFWWGVGKTIKLLGYWPLFYRTMMRIAQERYEARRHKK